MTALVTLLAALLGFVLLVAHDAMSRAATQQTQGLRAVATAWDDDCAARDAASDACAATGGSQPPATVR